MIPHTKPEFGKEEIKEVARVMKTGWVGYGPESALFEQEFAKYVGVKYALFTNCCTNALKMAFKYYKELGYDAYFIVNPNTYCATYAAAEETGLKKKGMKYVWTSVHFGGVKETTKVHIEDSAHRIEPNDPMIGKIRCYSFHPNKNMTANYGGMIVTNDKKIYNKLKLVS